MWPFSKSGRTTARRSPLSSVRALRLPQARPQLEALETRLVPYAVTGNAWPNPQLITISFVPDGTVLAQSANGNLTSNLFSTLNKKFGSAATWENQILKAAQTWAAQTNINFAVVSDDGSPTTQQNADVTTVNTLVVHANTPLTTGAESGASSSLVVGTVGSNAVIRFDSAHTTGPVSSVPSADRIADTDSSENRPAPISQPPMVVPAADEMIVPDQPQRIVPGNEMAEAALQRPHIPSVDHDACFSDDASPVNLPLSAERLADATTSDWDSAAALAAVSALLAGTWSQWEKKTARKPLQAKGLS